MSNVLDLKHPEALPELPVEPVKPSPNDGVAAELGLDLLAEPDPLEWEAHHPLNAESRYRHYLALSGFAVVGGAISWWQASPFSFIAIALALVAWELQERFSKPVRVRLDERGVAVNGMFYPHATLSSFDLHQMSDGTVDLSLATRQWHSPRLRLPLGSQDPHTVRGLLLNYVPEEPHPIPLVDRLIRR